MLLCCCARLQPILAEPDICQCCCQFFHHEIEGPSVSLTLSDQSLSVDSVEAVVEILTNAQGTFRQISLVECTNANLDFSEVEALANAISLSKSFQDEKSAFRVLNFSGNKLGKGAAPQAVDRVLRACPTLTEVRC